MGQRQVVPSLGFARTGIEHRRGGLVHEQFGRALQIGDQSYKDRAQLECCPDDPLGERGTVEISVLAAHDLGNAVGARRGKHIGDCG
jgi:hypothetical protein